MNGKKHDVLIYDDEPLLGADRITVWADEGMRDVIKAVPGVAQVIAFTNQYQVQIDPRYDTEYVKKEIIAAIKCAPGNE